MIYNELAQLLETEDPETGELYSLDDLNIVDFNEVGSAMLQDHIMARESWLAGDTNGTPNEQIATCFLRASFEGWIHCRDNADACVDIVLNQGTILGEGHQHWMMNEINALVWPSPDGVGILDLGLVAANRGYQSRVRHPLGGAIGRCLQDGPCAGCARRHRWRCDGRRLREGRSRGDAGRRVSRSLAPA